MTEADKIDRYGEVVGRFNSRSRPDDVYEVRIKDGRLSCNCKGWIFNRESPKRCRHTTYVAQQGNVESRLLQAAQSTIEAKRAQQKTAPAVDATLLEIAREIEAVLDSRHVGWTDQARARVMGVLVRHSARFAKGASAPVVSNRTDGVRLITFDD